MANNQLHPETEKEEFSESDQEPYLSTKIKLTEKEENHEQWKENQQKALNKQKIYIIIAVTVMLAVGAWLLLKPKHLQKDKQEFQCNQQHFLNWSQTNAKTITLNNQFKIQNLPYLNLFLLLETSDHPPKTHFSELVTYIEKNPPHKSVYIHSAPPYLALLAGAASFKNVTIVLADSNPEKSQTQSNFVINGLHQKVLIQEPSDTQGNIERSDFLITTSPQFANAHPEKNIIFYANSQVSSFSSELVSRILVGSPCSQLLINFWPATYLQKGLYKIRQSRDANKVYKNKEFQLITCRETYFELWNQTEPKFTILNSQKKIQNLPYPNLFLLEEINKTSPTIHFPELITFLKKNPPKESIYVHSASPYLTLLVGAASLGNVSIILAHDYDEKSLAISNLVINGLNQKIVLEQPSNSQDSIQKADFLITTSSKFAKIHPEKKIIFYTDSEIPNLFTKDIFHISPFTSLCSQVEITLWSGKYLQKGLYSTHI